MEAVLRWRGQEPDWYAYAAGYRRPVEALTALVDQTARYQDALVVPGGRPVATQQGAPTSIA
jgi:hypothetical protein